ncbi:PspC domain-containing protein [Streptomyces chromofuscus]|uniref:PspC domain-containing protein n=1 Tax=Streptomyces chromofuscus TaxID=42881 RepID=A0A7M2T1M4_STRCW|nr:PspC domain-containing protein [Streptomyces chromofuscus]QOV42486.1 PspC domain-containing protein [Streptomyces chromofuscus]GGT26851.1 membrane protein [Streptomyces chromofuscus]
MTDHQHAADAVPDAGTASDAPAATAAGEEPRVHERAGAPGRSATDAGGGAGVPGGPGGPGGPGTFPGGPGAAGEPGAPEGAGALEPPHKFRRDRRHKMFAGVCAGLGRQCDMDPVIFRITLAVLSATGGIGLIFYGFAWLFVPYDNDDENEVRKLLTGRVDGQALTAVLFALVGCGVFLTMLKNGGVLTFAVILSLLLAGAAYWSQRRGAPDPDPLAAQAVADAPPEAQAPPVPAAYPSWWRDPIVKDGTHVGRTGYLWGPSDSRDRDIAAAVNISLDTDAGPQTAESRRTAPPKPRGPRWTGGWIFLFALLAGAIGTRVTWDEQPLGTSLQTGLACALVVIGLGIAVSSLLGRTGAGSIFLAVLTAALLAGAAALPKNVGTEWIRTTWRPAAVADLKPKYDLGTGVGTLDLTRLNPAEGQTVSTDAEVGVGRLRVIVPPDVTVKADIDVGVGDIQLPGEQKQDVDVQPGRYREVTLAPQSGAKGAGTVDLDLKVGVGQVEVTRAAS